MNAHENFIWNSPKLEAVWGQILKDSLQDDNEFTFYPAAKISPLGWLQNHLIDLFKNIKPQPRTY